MWQVCNYIPDTKINELYSIRLEMRDAMFSNVFLLLKQGESESSFCTSSSLLGADAEADADSASFNPL